MTDQIPSVAIMQPYIFPYLGYFQLVRAVDHFVSYDDVQFIKRGWINRNRISAKGQDMLFTVPVQGASQKTRICDVIAVPDDKWLRKFAMQMQHEYRKAPHYSETRDLVMNVFETHKDAPISELALHSVAAVMEQLGLPFVPHRSSEAFADSEDLKRADRLISITRKLGGQRYVNLPGGMALYGTEEFAAEDVDLRFIFDRSGAYEQFGHPFIANLSIIDVLMHNDPATVRDMLQQYRLLSAEETVAIRAEDMPADQPALTVSKDA